MIFNPLRRRPPQNPMNMAPAGYDAPQSPGMAPQSPGAAPAATAAPTAFRQSLDVSRALDANKAATFANMAPLPSADSQSAYGSVGASTAARAAYVGNEQAKADLYSGGYFTGHQLEQDQNFRANQESGANAALTKGQAAVQNANATVGIPAQANATNATANATNATAAETKALTPEKVVGQRIQNQGAAYMAPMAPLIAGAEIARKQAETAAIQQKTPAEVKAIEGNAGAGRALNDERGHLIDEQQRLLNAKMANMAPAPAAAAPEPGADFELKQKQYEFYKKNGMDAQAQALFPPRTMTPVPQQSVGGDKAPQPAGPMPSAAPSEPKYPEGTRSKTKDGTPVVFRGGKWVPA